PAAAGAQPLGHQLRSPRGEPVGHHVPAGPAQAFQPATVHQTPQLVAVEGVPAERFDVLTEQRCLDRRPQAERPDVSCPQVARVLDLQRGRWARAAGSAGPGRHGAIVPHLLVVNFISTTGEAEEAGYKTRAGEHWRALPG